MDWIISPGRRMFSPRMSLPTGSFLHLFFTAAVRIQEQSIGTLTSDLQLRSEESFHHFSSSSGKSGESPSLLQTRRKMHVLKFSAEEVSKGTIITP